MTTPTGRTSSWPADRNRSVARFEQQVNSSNGSGLVDRHESVAPSEPTVVVEPDSIVVTPDTIDHTVDDIVDHTVDDIIDDTVDRTVNPDVYLVGPTEIDAAADSSVPVDGVAVLTLDDGKDEPHLVFVNDGLCDLTGWRADELLGQPPTKLFARNRGRNEVEAMIRALGLDLPVSGARAASTNGSHNGAHANGSNNNDTITNNTTNNGHHNGASASADGEGTDGSLDILDLIEVESTSTESVTFIGDEVDRGGDINSNGDGPDPSVQERAQRMLGSMGEDLFDLGDSLFGDTPLSMIPSLSAMEVDLRSTIDLDLNLAGNHAGRSYASVTHMLTRDQQQVPVYFTAHMVASSSGNSSTLVCQVHDLRRATAERLLADKEAVVASLSRGHHLGQLCHQIAVMVEKSLGVSATCWVLIANELGELEPVITGGFDADVVAATAAVAQSNAKPVKRVFGSASLPSVLSEPLLNDGVSDLWYVPVMADPDMKDRDISASSLLRSRAGTQKAAGRRPEDQNPAEQGESVTSQAASESLDLPVLELSAVVDLDEGTEVDQINLDEPVGHHPVAAIMVATGHSSPDRKATVLLEHMAEVLGTAVSHATSELNDHHQALHDPLTQLPNRALIVDRLGQAMARLDRDGVALSVLLVDIDRFKWINDTHGVDVGDRVLVEVAERLLAAVRLGDTVGRIGSDQFLVICVATNGDLDTPAVGRRILRAVAEPILIPPSASDGDGSSVAGLDVDDHLSITASIGAVVVNEQAQRPATVIGNAESALSRAALLGRGKFAMFKAEHQDAIMRRHHIEQSLRRAIEGDELVLHYQPIVDISTGVMVGAEALLRWDRPGNGICGPDTFLPIAEESDLVMALDRWVIDNVCKTMERWPKLAGRWPLVSINLSARILGSESLVPTIREALERYDLPPIRLGFEITESMQVLDMQTALDNLNRLATLGSRIAIDDFGVGHASLDYLRTFSMATALKIDRSFVAGLTLSKEDKAIVTASIAMANSLGLHSVAEGVESVEQLLTLREMGCTYAQGFVLARPLPLDIVLEIWNREHLYQPKS